MSIIEDELGSALSGPVKRKANNTRKLRSKARRTASGVPEVMAKITGFGKGAAHIKAHLTYITRHGQIEMENESGHIFKGKEEVDVLFSEWAADIGESARRKNQRDTMHLVLSMPETVDSVSVHNAAREFTRKTFAANHDYVFALHTDTSHPHCHVTVKMKGHNGLRLNPMKADLQAWRDGFAEALQLQGVEANATARRSRGVVRKAEKSVIRHIERGDDKRPPRKSRVEGLQKLEVAREMMAELRGEAVTPKPWVANIAARQESVRNGWLNAAALLEQPRAPIAFKKDLINGSPDYDNLDARAVRRGQLSAGLYQSGHPATRSQEPAGTIAGMRNLSGIPLVQSQGTTEMLLHAHARFDMGHDGRRPTSAGDRVRRPGDRVDGPGRPNGARDAARVGQLSALKLAAQIRGFVQELPGVETKRDVLRRELQEHLERERERLKAPAPQLAQPLAGPRRVEPTDPPRRDRDLGSER